MQTNFFTETKSLEPTRKRKFSANSESNQSTDDENNIDKCGSCKNSKHTKNPTIKKYKTELCKNFSETGSCPYRKKCKFAHGTTQLHTGKADQSRFYRTKKCNSFWSEGTCGYGQRCQFMHIKVQGETRQTLQMWRMVIQMQTNESGFAGSRLLGLLGLE